MFNKVHTSGNYFHTDVLIIGAGPVGIFASFQAGLLGMKTVIVDALVEEGGQLNALYPHKNVYDIPGFPKVVAKELIGKLCEQAGMYQPTLLLNQLAGEMTKSEDGIFKVKTSKENLIYCRAIIIAAGAGAFSPQTLALEGATEVEGNYLLYHVKDPEIFRDKKVMIAGGGDSAVDWSLHLSDKIRPRGTERKGEESNRENLLDDTVDAKAVAGEEAEVAKVSAIAKQVYLVHRRRNFRAIPASVMALESLAAHPNTNFELVTPYLLKSLKTDSGKLTGVLVEHFANKEQRHIEVDYLLAFYGLTRNLGRLLQWGLDVNQVHSTIKVQPTTCQTSVPGIFAVGDVAEYPQKLKLIMVGFSEVAYALHSAWQFVFPDKVFRFVHSTSNNGLNASN